MASAQHQPGGNDEVALIKANKELEQTRPSRSSEGVTPWRIVASGRRLALVKGQATLLNAGVMHTVSHVARADGVTVRKRAFGSVLLGLGIILVVGVLLLVVGEAAIALRVHEELLLEAEQSRSPTSFNLRFEVHDFFAPGLAYVPLHVWVLWAGFCLAFSHVARRNRAGSTIFFVALALLVIEHALRACLGHNGIYIGIPINVFPW